VLLLGIPFCIESDYERQEKQVSHEGTRLSLFP
jgi:hypothetical protein